MSKGFSGHSRAGKCKETVYANLPSTGNSRMRRLAYSEEK